MAGGHLTLVCFAGHDEKDLLKILDPPAPKQEPPRPRPQESPPRAQPRPQNDSSRRLLPQNLDAEMSVLGSVFIDNEALASARKVITTVDFYLDQHRTLFGAMCELVDHGQPVDAITMKTWLRQHNKVEQIGPAYIAELVSIVPDASNVSYYAGLVQDAAVKRRIASSASEIATMAFNGVAAESLIGEWQRRVTVLDRGLMTPAEIPWEELGQATQANEEYLERRPVIDKLCYSSAVSMVVGGKHAGKSTLARWMAICVARGIPFLKREVMQGPVFYIASEDEEMAARLELIRLGWQPGDPLRFFGKSKIRADDFDFLGMLTKEIQRYKAVLVIVDMLFDFVRIDDEMSYAGTRRAVGKIQDVASDSEAHLCVLHHAPKNAQIGDATIAALGSQGLAARVSPIILVRRFGPNVHSISSTAVRDPRGEGLEESRLFRNADGSVQLGGIFKSYMLAEVYIPKLLDILESEPDAEFTINELAEALGPETGYAVARQSLASMYKQGMVGRRGSGRKGQPYRYYYSGSNTPPENSESETYRGDVSNYPQAETTTDLEAQGRFGYKEREYPPADDLSDITRSK